MKIKNVGIIGLGYVGGPLAYLTAYNGYNVVGIDNSNEAILKINNRVNIPKQLKQYKFDKLNLLATKDYTKLKEMDEELVMKDPFTSFCEFYKEMQGREMNTQEETIMKEIFDNVKGVE